MANTSRFLFYLKDEFFCVFVLCHFPAIALKVTVILFLVCDGREIMLAQVLSQFTLLS